MILSRTVSCGSRQCDKTGLENKGDLIALHNSQKGGYSEVGLASYISNDRVRGNCLELHGEGSGWILGKVYSPNRLLEVMGSLEVLDCVHVALRDASQ